MSGVEMFEHYGKVISFDQADGRSLVGVVAEAFEVDGRLVYKAAVPTQGVFSGYADTSFEWSGPIPAGGVAQ